MAKRVFSLLMVSRNWNSSRLMGSCSRTASMMKSATRVSLWGVADSSNRAASTFSWVVLPLDTATFNCDWM